MLSPGGFERACAARVGLVAHAAEEGRGAAVGWLLGVGVAGVERLVLWWEGGNNGAFVGGGFGLDGRRCWLGLGLGLL